jgi:hypothetical protein
MTRSPPPTLGGAADEPPEAVVRDVVPGSRGGRRETGYSSSATPSSVLESDIRGCSLGSFGVVPRTPSGEKDGC